MEELIYKLLSSSNNSSSSGQGLTEPPSKGSAESGAALKPWNGQEEGLPPWLAAEPSSRGNVISVTGALKWLLGGSAAEKEAAAANPGQVWPKIAQHLQRIAGSQVRPFFEGIPFAPRFGAWLYRNRICSLLASTCCLDPAVP